MNKREVMKVENLVRNYKMVYSDRQDEEEIKVGQDEPLFKVTLNKPIPKFSIHIHWNSSSTPNHIQGSVSPYMLATPSFNS